MFKKNMITAILCFIPVIAVNAAILVVDQVQIGKVVEEGLIRAKEAAQQYEQLKKEYEQSVQYAEAQKKRLEGFTNFSSGFDTASSYMKSKLGTITDVSNYDVNSTLDKYSLNSSDGLKSRLEGAAAKVKFYDTYNTELKSRATKLETLQASYNEATTPQQKADLTLQLQTEQINMQYFMKQNEIAEKQMEQQDKLRQEQLRKEWLASHTYKG